MKLLKCWCGKMVNSVLMQKDGQISADWPDVQDTTCYVLWSALMSIKQLQSPQENVRKGQGTGKKVPPPDEGPVSICRPGPWITAHVPKPPLTRWDISILAFLINLCFQKWTPVNNIHKLFRGKKFYRGATLLFLPPSFLPFSCNSLLSPFPSYLMHSLGVPLPLL
jgi:hypothetical protein